MRHAVSRAAAARPQCAAAPPGAWPCCDLDTLAELLASGESTGCAWTVVEFWAPDNLFSRSLAPVRARLPRSHGARLRLLCCVLPDSSADCSRFGVGALPAIVLFHGARRVRRWLGAVDPFVLAHGIDAALAGAAA